MTQHDDIEDILFDLVEDGQLSAQAVADAIARYPEHTNAITDFAAAWQSHRDDNVEIYAPLPAPDLSRLWNSQAAGIDPFEGKDPFELRDIAARCDLSMNIMVKFAERLLKATSIPMLLIRRLADELKVPPGTLLDYLDQQQAIGASDFRSDGNPVVGQKQTFADAVRSSSMSDERKEKWLSLSE
ncbi:hypothetical protein [Rhizobium johnstonii]|uniref:hypothetical protein n=1 Tax=Rhizobium johnstonii TaxID=3019933 RepID=UPI002DDCBE1B|nr:hypothetical protein U8P72_11975 [Rhizobium johnstonii]